MQKNLRFGVDDVGGHCINIIVAYLFQIRRIGQQTSLLGAFQIVLRFIEETDFSATDLYFAGGTSNRNDGSWSAKLYHPVGKDADEVQFNSLWRVSSSALQDLRNESKVALGLLQLDSDVGFNRIFLQGSHYLSRYDLIFHVPLDLFSDSASTAEEEDMTVCQFVSSKALSVARQALNNRVKAISSSVRNVCISGTSSTSSSVSSWDIKSFSKRPSDSYVVTIGLVIDNEHAHRRVDKGVDPSLDESTASDGMMTAADFRSFWGAKSELRRFRDGAIVDAVVWGDQVSDTGTSKSREVTGESIVESIVRYSLGMHLSSCSGTKGERIVSLGSCLEEALPAADYIRRNLSEDTGNQKALDATINSRYVKAVESLDRLRGILTSDMKDLPLVFESISGSQASLRYTSLLPPVPNPLLVNSKDMLKAYSGVSLSLIAHPMLLIGQVEGGGKWPSEREAAKKIKTALLLRTAHLLRNQFQVNYLHINLTDMWKLSHSH